MCAAEPILASTLLNDEDLDDLFEGLVDAGAKKRIELGRRGSTLGTGVREVDDVLCGGLRAGRMVGVSGEGGEVGRLSKLSLVCVTAVFRILGFAGRRYVWVYASLWFISLSTFLVWLCTVDSLLQYWLVQRSTSALYPLKCSLCIFLRFTFNLS